jgi:hypothetical protein
VVVVVELTAIVVEVEVEVTVVMEEGVALRRGSLVLAPSEEKSTVVLVPPLRYQFYTNTADERASAGRGSPVAGRLEWLGVHVVAVARRHEERVAIVK